MWFIISKSKKNRFTGAGQTDLLSREIIEEMHCFGRHPAKKSTV
jgi:hypothetical protein